MSILMIDDSVADQLIFKSFFQKKSDAEFNAVTKRADLLPALSEHHPKVIVVDTRLQGCTGYDILEDIKSNDYQDVYLIMTSGAKALIDENLALSLGVDEIVEKDSTFGALIEAILRGLEAKGASSND